MMWKNTILRRSVRQRREKDNFLRKKKKKFFTSFGKHFGNNPLEYPPLSHFFYLN
jgi:hypothetical protein